MNQLSEKQLSFDCAMKIVNKQKWIQIKDIERLGKFVQNQQSTICKLQDLCGKSDYENAKLRLKNKELQEEIKLLKPTNAEQYEQIVQLQEENEQLESENKKLQCINDQLEERLENSGIGVALKMDCDEK